LEKEGLPKVNAIIQFERLLFERFNRRETRPMDARAHQKDKTTKMIRAWIDQFAHVLQSTDTKEFIHVLVLDPFIKYIMGQMFPYLLIVFCLFGAVLIVVIMTFVVVLFRPGLPPSFKPDMGVSS
jgi:hypothetical protein